MICGLKLTHDGAVAVIDHGRLLFSVEVEKLGNRSRHSSLDDSAVVREVLEREGIALSDIEQFVVDGWARFPDGAPSVEVLDGDGKRRDVGVAGYTELTDARVCGDPGVPIEGILPLGPGSESVAFRSYLHATDHAACGYATSTAARDGRAALILVWDGGMPACLYSFDPETRVLSPHGVVLDIVGALYPVFAACFPPFHPRGVAADETEGKLERVLHAVRAQDPAIFPAFLPISGKAMAYAALGEPSEEALAILDQLTSAMLPLDGRRAFLWSRRALRALAHLSLSDARVLATFSKFLEARLVDGLKEKILRFSRPLPLVFVGGCALNIKWNAALRASGLFEDVWVPPFPNDAGSAIGAACSEMLARPGPLAVQWELFSGAPLGSTGSVPAGWSRRPASIEDVAALLHESGEPVVVLSGRAELGPRALGHRSILAPATSPAMKDRLNAMKKREAYRPVAPICLEHRAAEVFRPGSRDPYMLFDHHVREAWKERIPAVVHADGTARLQTVDPGNRLMHELLTAYEERSGIPVLCNTSANLPGCGFFPDAASAMRWGEARYVWADGTLFHSSVDDASLRRLHERRP